MKKYVFVRFIDKWEFEIRILFGMSFLFQNFVPLFSEFEAIYARNCYMRVRDVFERPISSVPGGTVRVLDRYTTDYCWSFRYEFTD